MKVQKFLILFLGILWISCGPSVQEKVRMGDFEFSQANFSNALKRYNEAWKIDSTYPGLGDKITDMKQRLSSFK